jgi:hypothetical protein
MLSSAARRPLVSITSVSFDHVEIVRPLPSERAGVRAGVHSAPPSASAQKQPPMLFAAVEMAMLVLVAALAMVTVILTASEDANAAGRSAFVKTTPIRPAAIERTASR